MTTTPQTAPETESTATVEAPAAQAPAAPDIPATASSASTTAPTATWTASDWLGKVLIDRDGERIGKLQDVYVDVETDEPQFGTVKEGFLGRHLTFVPLVGVEVGPDELNVDRAQGAGASPHPTWTCTGRRCRSRMSPRSTTTSR